MKKIFAIALIFLIYLPQANGQVKLPMIVSDSMILQRDVKLKIWGWASANEKLQINFHGKNYKTKADGNGNWLVWLAPMKAGGPFTMKISGKNKITLKDICLLYTSRCV